ncbi:MAG: hypothetical protein QM757_28075 [Paludibaculum sp.]
MDASRTRPVLRQRRDDRFLGVGVELREVARLALEECGHLGLDGGGGVAGPGARDGLEIGGSAAFLHGGDAEGEPDVDAAREVDGRGCHADDRDSGAIEADLAAEDGGVG